MSHLIKIYNVCEFSYFRLRHFVKIIPVNEANGYKIQGKNSALFTFVFSIFNPLHTGRHVHCYILDESICHFRSVGTILSL